MNKFKLLLSLILVLAMVMSFGAFVYADETPADEARTFTVDGEAEEVTATPITSDLTTLEGGETYVYYYVDGTVQMDHTLEVNGECAIILCEDCVLEFTQSGGVGLQLNTDSGLGVYDCDGGTGVIKAAEADTILVAVTGNSKFNLNGGDLYAAGTCIVATDTGVVVLNEGTVETGESEEYAVMFQDESSAEMTNATIKAGGIGVLSDCNDFTMYGGEIVNCVIGVQNVYGFNMYGGEIQNCVIGVQNYGELILGGTARIIDNGADGICANVDMLEGSSITMGKAAEEGFAVGLWSENIGTDDVTEVLVMTGASEADLEYFSYDMEGQDVYIKDGCLYVGIATEEPASTGSVFSGSTGLIFIGTLVIVIAASIIVIIRRKKAIN